METLASVRILSVCDYCLPDYRNKILIRRSVVASSSSQFNIVWGTSGFYRQVSKTSYNNDVDSVLQEMDHVLVTSVFGIKSKH